MLAGFGSGYDLLRVVKWVTANREGMNVGIREHLLEIVICLDSSAVLCAQVASIELTRGINGRDLAETRGIDGGDVRRGHPAISDNSNIILLHPENLVVRRS